MNAGAGSAGDRSGHGGIGGDAAGTELLDELVARQQITDVLFRYARGVDRLDLAAVEGCYWPDAIDHHGAYRGPASGLVADIAERHATIDSSQHCISNVLIEFDDHDTARVESYCLCFLRQQRSEGRDDQDILIVRCRYLDRFDRRDGRWRIGARVVAYDETQQTTVVDSTDDRCAVSRRDRTDWVYSAFG